MVIQNTYIFQKGFLSILDLNFSRKLLDFGVNGGPLVVLECWNGRVWHIGSTITVISATCTISIIIIMRFLKRGVWFYFWTRRAIYCRAFIGATTFFTCKQIRQIWLIIWQPCNLGKDTIETFYKQFCVFTYLPCAFHERINKFVQKRILRFGVVHKIYKFLQSPQRIAFL